MVVSHHYEQKVHRPPQSVLSPLLYHRVLPLSAPLSTVGGASLSGPHASLFARATAERLFSHACVTVCDVNLEPSWITPASQHGLCVGAPTWTLLRLQLNAKVEYLPRFIIPLNILNLCIKTRMPGSPIAAEPTTVEELNDNKLIWGLNMGP